MASAQAGGAEAAAGAPGEFIGALISLISRSDVRYQGFLAQIDPVAATIALEQGEQKSPCQTLFCAWLQ